MKCTLFIDPERFEAKIGKRESYGGARSKNSMRLLEERLLKEKRAEIELIETGHRDDSMKMMESQRISINALKFENQFLDSNS